jgi:hypothetical protein
MSFWFRKKYGLPPTDPRFLEATPEQIEEDFWAHHYYDNPTAESHEDPDFDAQKLLADDDDDWEEVISG